MCHRGFEKHNKCYPDGGVLVDLAGSFNWMEKGRTYSPIRGVVPGVSGSPASCSGVDRDQGCHPSPNNKRHYDRQGYQPPRAPFQHAPHLIPSLLIRSKFSSSGPRTTLSSLQILASSALSTSFSSVTTATASPSTINSRAMETKSLSPIPRFSIALPMLSNPSGCGTTRWIPAGSRSERLPTPIEQRGCCPNTRSAHTSPVEMAMMDPMKGSRDAGYCFNQHAAVIPFCQAPAATSFPPSDFGSSPPPFVVPSEERIANPDKNSRYLREMDRRQILQRIDQGEKQVTLAKEYQVSRAAICSLNKHREDVMLRKDANPLAKHPKKLKTANSALKVTSKWLPLPRLASVNAKGKNTHEVKSRAAALLLTSLRNKNTEIGEFRRSCERLVRLVLEEALALVPIKPVEVHMSDSVRPDGMGWEHPPCAISMENQQHQSESDGGKPASPLLDLFRAIEPDQPTAHASVFNAVGLHSEGNDVSQSKTQQVNLVDTHLLPASLKYHNVFIFDVFATSVDAICAVVQELQSVTRTKRPPNPSHGRNVVWSSC